MSVITTTREQKRAASAAKKAGGYDRLLSGGEKDRKAHTRKILRDAAGRRVHVLTKSTDDRK